MIIGIVEQIMSSLQSAVHLFNVPGEIGTCEAIVSITEVTLHVS